MTGDKPDLQAYMERAMDVFTLFCALQEAGFERGEALVMTNSMVITGVAWKREL
jgi:hypothetical protein